MVLTAEEEDDLVRRRVERRDPGFLNLSKEVFGVLKDGCEEDGSRTRLDREVERYVFEAERLQGILDAMHRQANSCAAEIEREKQEALEIERDIDRIHNELQAVEIAAKQQVEYNKIAQEIQKLPSRSETTWNLDALSSEISKLQESRSHLEQSLHSRKEQLVVFFKNLESLGIQPT